MKKKQVSTPETVETPQEWVINCSKCGASLSVKNDGKAYICSVCGTIFRVRKDEKNVEIPVREKKIELSITEGVVNVLTKKYNKPITNPKKASKKFKKALKVLLQNNVYLTNYDVVDTLEFGMNGKRIAKK